MVAIKKKKKNHHGPYKWAAKFAIHLQCKCSFQTFHYISFQSCYFLELASSLKAMKYEEQVIYYICFTYESF